MKPVPGIIRCTVKKSKNVRLCPFVVQRALVLAARANLGLNTRASATTLGANAGTRVLICDLQPPALC